MDTKKYFYAAVGAPVAAMKQTQERVEELRGKMSSSRKSMLEDLQKQFDVWAGEGEELVHKIGDSKAIDEINDFVDFDQMQEQVSKLRDQLEDLLETWRTNFRPAGKAPKIAEKVEVEVKEPAKTPAAKKPATTRKPAAKKTTTAAKKPATTRKPVAQKTTTTAKKPATKAS